MNHSRDLLSTILAFFLFSQCILARQQLPNVTLPWGTWHARSLNPHDNVLTFTNIRFAKPPTGALRFQRPQSPDPISYPEMQLMDNTYGPQCHQVNSRSTCTPAHQKMEISEDCLFLDVYVPQSVWQRGQQGIANTPVVVWLHPGVYEYGAKDIFGDAAPFYQGNGVMAAAAKHDEDVIFISGNYRLGAFGWMAGASMEEHGTANAGLYDQRMLLQWVQDYVHLFGGDKSHVSVWGESAGAGSIMHHLMGHGGKQDPLFQHAFVQSPAFQWNWDRFPGGKLDQVFNNFTLLANCPKGDFQCLTNAPIETLDAANQILYDSALMVGLVPVGPSIDGGWIKELPSLAYQEGRIWKGLESLAVSHVSHEATTYIPPYIQKESDFDFYLNNFIPAPYFANIRNEIAHRYPSQHYSFDQQKRTGEVIRDSTFNCQVRAMYNGYNSSMDVYMMNYNFGATAAVHASDIIPVFWTATLDFQPFLERLMCMEPKAAHTYAETMSRIAPLYQEYLADLAVSGNPNAHAKRVPWQPAELDNEGYEISNILKVQTGWFEIDKDPMTSWDLCDFWYDAALNITAQYEQVINAKKDTRKGLFDAWEQVVFEL